MNARIFSSFEYYTCICNVPMSLLSCNNCRLFLELPSALEVARLVRGAYLPPYSPDLNPIEQAFSKLKAHQLKIGARTFTDLFNALGDICQMFTPDECWSYFQDAGYFAG